MSKQTDHFQDSMGKLADRNQEAVWLYEHLLQNCKDQQFSLISSTESLSGIEYIDKKTNQIGLLPVYSKGKIRKNDIDVLIVNHFFFEYQHDKNPVENGMKVCYKIRNPQELNEYIDSIT